MRIGLVHDWLTGMRGGEKCLELLCRAYPQAPIYTLLHVRGSVSPHIERHPIITSPLSRLPGIGRSYRWFLPLMPWAVRRLAIQGNVDLIVSLSHALAKGVRVPGHIPHLCYCFTPTRYAWDQRQAYFTGGAATQAAPGTRAATGYWSACKRAAMNRFLDRVQEWDKRSSQQVTEFVAISRFVAERIRNCYGREASVVYPPVDVAYYTPANLPREDFYLVVSALVPYKRVDLAISACQALGRKLVIIGRGPQMAWLKSQASDQVQFLGWQPDDVIRQHLRRCRGFLFPGVEDFGIAPLEAQACGAPVIALGQGGARESLHPATESSPGGSIFFEEPNTQALIEAICWAETHPSQLDPALARAGALRFTPEKFLSGLQAAMAAVLANAGKKNAG